MIEINFNQITNHAECGHQILHTGHGPRQCPSLEQWMNTLDHMEWMKGTGTQEHDYQYEPNPLFIIVSTLAYLLGYPCFVGEHSIPIPA